MPHMEGDLMRGQADLAPLLDQLELDRNHLPRLPEGDEAIRDAEVYPGLNAGNKAAWEVFL
jgi:hypothetical protein